MLGDCVSEVMEYMTEDNLNIVSCKGKYSELKLSVNFIAAYFTAQSKEPEAERAERVFNWSEMHHLLGVLFRPHGLLFSHTVCLL